jgi:hypothetical protein
MRSLASSSPWARYADWIAISTCAPVAVFAIASAPKSAFGVVVVSTMRLVLLAEGDRWGHTCRGGCPS